MESAIFENILNINEKLDDFVILQVNSNDNSYKQISIEDFLDKLSNIEIKLQKSKNTINYGPFTINTDSSEVYRGEIKIDLSPREYKMFLLFIDNKGKVLTSEQIINCVWGIAYADAGMLRVAIKRLRNKIDPNNKCLKTIRGKGYILKD